MRFSRTNFKLEIKSIGIEKVLSEKIALLVLSNGREFQIKMDCNIKNGLNVLLHVHSSKCAALNLVKCLPNLVLMIQGFEK